MAREPNPCSAPPSSDDVVEQFEPLGMIGRNPAFVDALRLIKRFASCTAPVLIQGETGTGKELAARGLHYLGDRRDGPFVPVNCGALTDTLFESELFGHEQGAFTDARKAHQGLIAHAEGGTLFLDEVDSLSGRAQVALLRFLQDQHYRPVGSNRLRRANVSLVAACNKDLHQLVEWDRFRRDLLYRLNVVEIWLPPLRKRVDDIEPLARHFIDQLSARYEQPPKELGVASLQWLEEQPWPGNVRELENVIHRAWMLGDGPRLRLGPDGGHDSPPSVARRGTIDAFATSKARAIRTFEIDYLHRLLDEADGNVTLAARLAETERRTLGRLLKKHRIDRMVYCREETRPGDSRTEESAERG